MTRLEALRERRKIIEEVLAKIDAEITKELGDPV
jgi:hypothetical protein